MTDLRTALMGMLILSLTPQPALGAGPATIDTLAGGGVGDSLPGLETNLTGVLSIAADGPGNLYWTENNHLVGGQRARMWDATTGRVRTVAGNGLQKSVFDGPHGDGGPATKAFLHNPFGIAADSKGNVYVYDTGNSRVRRVDAETGIITKVADGFADPSPIEVDPQDRVLFAAGNTVQRYDPSTGAVTRVAGGGTLPLDGQPATQATLGPPQDIETDAAGNIYVSDSTRIRLVDTQGVLHTLAGGAAAQVDVDGQYGSLTKLQAGDHNLLSRPDGSLWFTDGSRMRRLAPAPEIAQLAGSRRVTTVFQWSGGYADGPLADSDFGWIVDMEGIAGGGFVVADSPNLRVRVVRDDQVSTVAGTGLSPWYSEETADIYDWTGDGLAATNAYLSDPCAVAGTPEGDVLVTEGGFHHRVRRVDAETGIISTLAGSEGRGSSGDGGPATEATLDSPCGLAVAPDGDVYVADGPSHVVRRVEADTGVITTVAGDGGVENAGDGPATQVSLKTPRSLALGADGTLYIADPGNNKVRRLTDGNLLTVAGSGIEGYSGDGGPAPAARLRFPGGVALQADGSVLVADSGNNVIRRVGLDGRIRTIAGDGEAAYSGDGGPWLQAQLYYPGGLAVDPGTGSIFVADTINQVVRRLDPDGIIRAAVGNGVLDFCGDGGPAEDACLRNPQSVAFVGSDLLVADYSSLRVRVVRL